MLKLSENKFNMLKKLFHEKQTLTFNLKPEDFLMMVLYALDWKRSLSSAWMSTTSYADRHHQKEWVK